MKIKFKAGNGETYTGVVIGRWKNGDLRVEIEGHVCTVSKESVESVVTTDRTSPDTCGTKERGKSWRQS